MQRACGAIGAFMGIVALGVALTALGGVWSFRTSFALAVLVAGGVLGGAAGAQLLPVLFGGDDEPDETS